MNEKDITSDGGRRRLGPLTITAIYALVSALWVLFSDHLLAALVTDPATLTDLQTAKGWLFVALTAGLLYWLINRMSGEQRRLVESLGASEKRLRSTLDEMLEGCQIIDHHWRYVYINDAAAKQGRSTKEELLGHTMQEMYPGIEDSQVFPHLRGSMSNRVPREVETEFTFPDGSTGWFDLRIEPVPEGILVLSVDITRRRQLEEETNQYRQRLEQIVAERTAAFAQANERLSRTLLEHQKAEESLELRATILDNAAEAIFLLNPNGDLLYANDAACKMYGFERNEFPNLNIRQLLSVPDAQMIEQRLKVVLETGQLELEAVHKRRDGSLMPVRACHSLVRTKHGEFIVSAIRDISGESGLRRLLERMPGIIWTTDAELILTASMGAGLEAIGAQPGEGTGMALSEYMERYGFGEAALAAFQRSSEGASVRYQADNRKLGKTYSGWAAPLRNAQGEIEGTIGMAFEDKESSSALAA